MFSSISYWLSRLKNNKKTKHNKTKILDERHGISKVESEKGTCCRQFQQIAALCSRERETCEEKTKTKNCYGFLVIFCICLYLWDQIHIRSISIKNSSLFYYYSIIFVNDSVLRGFFCSRERTLLLLYSRLSKKTTDHLFYSEFFFYMKPKIRVIITIKKNSRPIVFGSLVSSFVVSLFILSILTLIVI